MLRLGVVIFDGWCRFGKVGVEPIRVGAEPITGVEPIKICVGPVRVGAEPFGLVPGHQGWCPSGLVSNPFGLVPGHQGCCQAHYARCRTKGLMPNFLGVCRTYH